MTLTSQEVSQRFRNLSCWGVTFDKQSGVRIDLGGKIPRRRKAANPHLSEDVQTFLPTHDLFLTCPWEVRDGAGMKLGDELDGGELSRLLGESVESLIIEVSNYDLAARFSNGFALTARNVDDPSGYDSYSLKIDDVYWIVSPGKPPRDQQHFRRGEVHCLRLATCTVEPVSVQRGKASKHPPVVGGSNREKSANRVTALMDDHHIARINPAAQRVKRG